MSYTLVSVAGVLVGGAIGFIWGTWRAITFAEWRYARAALMFADQLHGLAKAEGLSVEETYWHWRAARNV
jgi:hypothetical protein